MTYRTLNQLADDATPEELFTGRWQNRSSILDEDKPCLDDRWTRAAPTPWKLWEEIVPLGYKGSYQRVRACLHDKRTSPPAGDRPAALPPDRRRRDPPPSGHPHRDRTTSAQGFRVHCSERDALTGHARSFAIMLTERQGERLPDWLDAVRRDEPSLHTLAAGIDRDRVAVIAGLTLPWTSGVVEGHVNRIKMLKRQMFGRAALRPLAQARPHVLTTDDGGTRWQRRRRMCKPSPSRCRRRRP